MANSVFHGVLFNSIIINTVTHSEAALFEFGLKSGYDVLFLINQDLERPELVQVTDSMTAPES